MSLDDVVLTYKDTTLFKDDLELLRDGNWINDKIISFYFEYGYAFAY